MGQFDRYLQTDLKTARKIQENPAYYDRLLRADELIKNLKIISELQFYAYALVLEELIGITYQDIQSFQRFKCEEYYKEVQSHLNPTPNPKERIKRVK